MYAVESPARVIDVVDVVSKAEVVQGQVVDNGSCFLVHWMERINDRYLRAMVERRSRKAGITKDVNPHTLRHTFATDLYRNTRNIRLVQKALGHSDLSTTMGYKLFLRSILDLYYKRVCKCLRIIEIYRTISKRVKSIGSFGNIMWHYRYMS